MSINPNDELAEIVVSGLSDENLILDDNKKEVLTKLKNGKATADDWKVWAENVIQTREKSDAEPATN